MNRFLQGWLLLLFFVPQAATSAEMRVTEISKVNVVPYGDALRIEVTLTGVVPPRVLVATHPDRLVLELPNTLTAAKQQHIAVNHGDVKDVRIGLRTAAPLLTRLVVDLKTPHAYELANAGNTISLTVLPGSTGTESTGPESASPAVPGVTALDEGKLDLPKHDPPKHILPQVNECAVAMTPAMPTAPTRPMRLGFRVKYVAGGAIYLSGGRSDGLQEDMRLSVRDSGNGGARLVPADEEFVPVAELRVLSVAANSTVTEISDAKRPIKPGDWAYLSLDDTKRLMATTASAAHAKREPFRVPSAQAEPVPALRVHVSSQDPLEVGRVRARIGLDYSGISSRGTTLGNSSQIGLSARTDITRIGGTHWNLEGYWRGRITQRSRTGQETLRDVLNKTYTMELDYDNPNSKWVVGVGRLYLPWASSLDTIDGGYIGRRVAKGVTAGAFAGSTPDPTSWRYNRDRRIGGAFVNFERGSFDSLRYTSTTGVALSTLKWDLDRPFVFFENGIYYKNSVSIYHSLIADAPQGLLTNGVTPGPGISRSYLTVHYQPSRRVSFDLYHNYFRDVPTAATQLVGTGLVDKLLYQGFSIGARVEPVRHFFLYTTLGQSDRTGDSKRTLNWMQGLTWDEIGRTGLRADFRYSRFDSSFAQGDYKVLTLSRHLGDRMMWDAQFGSRNLLSPFTVNRHSFFVDSSLDMNLGRHSYFQSGYTAVRGAPTNYNQWYFSLGYRFDGLPARK
jgi:hypothetical protein